MSEKARDLHPPPRNARVALQSPCICMASQAASHLPMAAMASINRDEAQAAGASKMPAVRCHDAGRRAGTSSPHCSKAADAQSVGRRSSLPMMVSRL